MSLESKNVKTRMTMRICRTNFFRNKKRKVIFKLDVKENNMLLNSSKTCMILPHTGQHGNFSPA